MLVITKDTLKKMLDDGLKLNTYNDFFGHEFAIGEGIGQELIVVDDSEEDL